MSRFPLFCRLFPLLLFFPALPLFRAPAVSAQVWFRSNSSGLSLERVPSREAAFSLAWALSEEYISPDALPEDLKPYYERAYLVEQRVLYERGKIKRRQWLFMGGGRVRINASFGSGGDFPPFIEFFSPEGFITRSIQLGAEIYTTFYSYGGGLLLGAETHSDSGALWTDSYRYTRSGKLRGMERRFLLEPPDEDPPPPEGGKEPLRRPGYLRFSPSPDRVREEFIDPRTPYDYDLIAGALQDVFMPQAARVVYSTDNLGRVLGETRYDAEGKIIAEISNTWEGGRITVIIWTAGEDRGRIEFDYDGNGSDRIAERDYRNGVLERTVDKDGDRETEEIYANGEPALRAIWEEGRKISEERL
ncbi:MAG: hypothetical protein LBQ44_10775 [Treponema sp.]|jgi:hypothetical protein|nr:hypothetical protein [Treponema sp.]